MQRVYPPEEIAELVGTLASALLRAHDPVEIAHVAVDHVSRSLNAEMVYLSVLPPEGKRLELIASVGLPSEFIKQRTSIPLESGFVAAAAVRTGELQQIPRLSELPQFEEYRPVRDLLHVGMNSYFAMPLVLAGETIGVLSLARSQEGRLSVVEYKLFESISQALSIGLQRARVREVEHRLEVQMKSIREAILSIDVETEPKAFLAEIVARACELTQARYGALGVLNEDGSGLSDFVTVGVTEETRRSIGHLPEGKGLLGAVIMDRRAIRVADLSKDPRSAGFPPGHPPMKTFLGIPLRVGPKIFGNFYLTEKSGGREFTLEDERMLELFGTQAALAVAHAHRVVRSEELRKKQAETFQELDRLRKVSAAIASHDLKNPVQAILMQIQLLRRQIGQGTPMSAGSLDNIERSARDLTVLAEDLLEAARIETGQLKISCQPLDLRELVPTIIETLKPTLGGHPVQVHVNVPAKILADPKAIDRIMTNLVVNSAKYSANSQPISVALESTSTGVELRIQDKGPGIAPEDLPYVFDRFYQAKEARRGSEGLGLGLFIVRGLVEAHHGKIWVESNPGEGSTFHVWFPRGEGVAMETQNEKQGKVA